MPTRTTRRDRTAANRVALLQATRKVFPRGRLPRGTFVAESLAVPATAQVEDVARMTLAIGPGGALARAIHPMLAATGAFRG